MQLCMFQYIIDTFAMVDFLMHIFAQIISNVFRKGITRKNVMKTIDEQHKQRTI